MCRGRACGRACPTRRRDEAARDSPIPAPATRATSPTFRSSLIRLPTTTLLVAQVTAERVREQFAGVVRGEVARYELPAIGALNFVLRERARRRRDALAGARRAREACHRRCWRWRCRRSRRPLIRNDRASLILSDAAEAEIGRFYSRRSAIRASRMREETL